MTDEPSGATHTSSTLALTTADGLEEEAPLSPEGFVSARAQSRPGPAAAPGHGSDTLDGNHVWPCHSSAGTSCRLEDRAFTSGRDAPGRPDVAPPRSAASAPSLVTLTVTLGQFPALVVLFVPPHTPGPGAPSPKLPPPCVVISPHPSKQLMRTYYEGTLVLPPCPGGTGLPHPRASCLLEASMCGPAPQCSPERDPGSLGLPHTRQG